VGENSHRLDAVESYRQTVPPQVVGRSWTADASIRVEVFGAFPVVRPSADVGCWAYRGGEGAVELAGDVPLQAAPDLLRILAFGRCAGRRRPGWSGSCASVSLRWCAAPNSGRDPRPVESIPHGPATAGRQWTDPAQGGERRLVAPPSRVGERSMAWAALTRPMPRRSINPGDDVVDDGLQVGAVGLELGVLRSSLRSTSPPP
jgi:hypothetical protein